MYIIDVSVYCQKFGTPQSSRWKQRWESNVHQEKVGIDFGLTINRNAISTAPWDLIARLIYSKRAAFREARRKRGNARDGHGNAITRFRCTPYNEATSRRRVLRKQPDLADLLKSKKAVTVAVAVASSMRASFTARFITSRFSLPSPAFVRQSDASCSISPTLSSNVVVVLFSFATLCLKSIDTFMQYRLSNVTQRCHL